MRKEFNLAVVLSLAHNVSLGNSFAGLDEVFGVVSHLEAEGVLAKTDEKGRELDTNLRLQNASGYLKKALPWVNDSTAIPPQTQNLKAIGMFLRLAREKYGLSVTLPVIEHK